MQNLARDNPRGVLCSELDRLFNHPGITLFRARELFEAQNYFKKYPLGIEKRILDLGCSEGHIGNMLFNKVDVGLDIGKDLEKAKEREVYRHLVLADAIMMPFKNGIFEVVFSNSTIEHVSDVGPLLREISRVLNKEGLFIFTVPSHKLGDYLFITTIFRKLGLSFLGLGKIYSKLRNKQLSHYNLFDELEWQRQLRSSSLNVVYKKYYLSDKDVYEWDKMCILLRITKPLFFIHQFLKSRFCRKVKGLLMKQDTLSLGGGLLIAAKKVL